MTPNDYGMNFQFAKYPAFLDSWIPRLVHRLRQTLQRLRVSGGPVSISIYSLPSLCPRTCQQRGVTDWNAVPDHIAIPRLA